VPTDDLEEVAVELDTRSSIKDGGQRAADEIAGDQFIFGVTENALEWAFGIFLHGFAYVFVACCFFGTDGQVKNRDVCGVNAEGHACQAAFKLWHGQGDCFGSTGGCGNDVEASGPAASPILLGWAVLSRLRGGDGVYRGHEAFSNAKGVMENLGDGCQTV